MNRFITDSQIIKWNQRLSDTPYIVVPKYHHKMNSYPMIVFKQQPFGNSLSQSEVITIDPVIDFRFSFSVAKNRVDNFFHIFDKIYSDTVETKTFYQNSNNVEKISDINMKSLNPIVKSQLDHLVFNKEYVKFIYDFRGTLSSIMMYVTFLEDTIEVFSKIWGYDEMGNEHQLSKFKIGDIISIKGNASDDYLIVDFHIEKGYNSMKFDYEISKIINMGQILQYEKSEVASENNICWSRNSRIDDILD